MVNQPFHYIEESNDEFLALFPHRFDFIYAPHPHPGQTPDWKTESRYPLSDRLIEQGASLFGVRFGAQTQYCLLDIDITSVYHPRHDPFAISRITAALEPLGLVRSICCSSSYSGGIHLYFPFSRSQRSWELAAVVSTLLERSGFKLAPGQLEMFPNPKTYSIGQPTRFNAHRLPMQPGSFILNEDFQPIWSDRHTFLQRWKLAQYKNDLHLPTFRQLLKQAKRKPHQVSGKAEKFINDLNAEIEFGWTGFGQTNRLLGRIAMRTYVFHHVLFGGRPLTGQALVDQIVAIARSLPGFSEWCRHQHEIKQRAEEWARCVENSHYFPYGTKTIESGTKTEIQDQSLNESGNSKLSWNQQQSEAVREKIRSAIAYLLEMGSLPCGITARFQALTQFGIGGSSLYRHRDLWHPDYLTSDPLRERSKEEELEEQPEEERTEITVVNSIPDMTSLFPQIARNALSDKESSEITNDPDSSIGCNGAVDQCFHPISSSNQENSSLNHEPLSLSSDRCGDLIGDLISSRPGSYSIDRALRLGRSLDHGFGSSEELDLLSSLKLRKWLEWLENQC